LAIDFQNLMIAIVPSMDIKSWDIQKFFIVYQTFTLSQIVRLTIVTFTLLSCKIKIISNLSDVQIQTIVQRLRDGVASYLCGLLLMNWALGRILSS
jgi:hypothetical protein